MYAEVLLGGLSEVGKAWEAAGFPLGAFSHHGCYGARRGVHKHKHPTFCGVFAPISADAVPTVG